MSPTELAIDPRVTESMRLVQEANVALNEAPEDERRQVMVCITTRDAESEFNDYHRWCGNFDGESVKKARRQLEEVLQESLRLLEKHRSPYAESVSKRLERLARLDKVAS